MGRLVALKSENEQTAKSTGSVAAQGKTGRLVKLGTTQQTTAPRAPFKTGEAAQPTETTAAPRAAAATVRQPTLSLAGGARSASSAGGFSHSSGKLDLPSVGERAGKTLTGAAKQYAAGAANAVGLSSAGQRGTAMSGVYEEQAQALEEQIAALEASLTNGALTPQQRKDTLDTIELVKQQRDIYRGAVRSGEQTAGEVYKVADDLARSGTEDIERAKEGLGSVGKTAIDVGVAGSQMLGDAALGGLTGSALAPMFLRSMGGSAQEARQAGASHEQQLAYGIASGALSVATEKLANLAKPFKAAFGGGVFDRALESAVARMNGSAAGKLALSFLSEGGEEVVEDLVQPVLQSIYNGQSIAQNYDELTLSEVLYDGLIGGILGGLGGGVELLGDAAQRRGQQTPAQETALPAPQTAQERAEVLGDETTLPTAENAPAAQETDALAGGKRIPLDRYATEQNIDGVSRGLNDGSLAVDAQGNIYRTNEAEHIDQRTSGTVGARSVKAFQFDHPEVHQFYRETAAELFEELSRAEKGGEIIHIKSVGVGDDQYLRMKRLVSDRIATLLDDERLSYDDIERALEAIINNHGQENFAAAKRVELMLDDMLSNGYRSVYGEDVAPNEAYLSAKRAIPGASEITAPEELSIWDIEEAAPEVSRETLARNVAQVRDAAAALGENGSRALSMVYNEETARSYAPEDAVRDFYQVYNAALGGKQSDNTTAPEHIRLAAQNAGERDARAASQAKYFGEQAGLVRDAGWRKAKLTSKQSYALDALAKVTGTQIRFADTVEDGGANASYKNGVITLALNAQDPVMTSAVHETVHRIRETAPEAYEALASFVQDSMSEESTELNLAVREILYETDDSSLLTEETVADAFGTMLEKSDVLAQFTAEHRSAAQRIHDALHDLLVKIRRALDSKDVTLSDNQRAAFRDLAGKVSEMETLFTEALKTTQGKAQGKESAANEGGETRYIVKNYDIDPIKMVEGAIKSTPATTTSNIAQNGGDVKQGFPVGRDDSGAEFYDSEPRFSKKVKDKDTLKFLDEQKTITTYKTMQLIDGKLYPPMAARVNGAYEDASTLGEWEQAVEHPELIKNGNKFKLDKGKGAGSIEAAYNPYMHSSNLVLNDQFSGAYTRDNLVTVECEVPASEENGSYRAQGAKDATGWHAWHTGTVAGQLRAKRGTERQVFLSRYIKPVRIVPDAEVAQMYKTLLDGTDIAIPDNVVTPSLRSELEKAGVPIKNTGRVNYEEKGGGKTKFSLKTDSEGRTLTEAQEEYFKDSKVRDAEGRLKPVYHGTGADFNEFSYDFMSMHGSMEGQGFYFTDNRSMAEGYHKDSGRVMEGYLGIQKPLSDSEVTLTRAELKKLLQKIDPTGDDVVINYDPAGGMGYPSRTWYNRALSATVDAIYNSSASDSEILADIANSGAGTETVVRTTRDVLGYDGYIVPGKYDGANVYVAFESNQFKNITNQNPTSSEDIRRSLSTRDVLDAYAEQYGEIPAGEKPSRTVSLPRRTAKDKYVSQTIRTVLEAKATPDVMIPTIEDMVAKGDFSYDRYTDKQAVADAEATIKKEGWQKSLNKWKRRTTTDISKEAMATGWALYNNAAASGDVESALDILNSMVSKSRNAAQALQAVRILKKQTPSAQLYGVQRSVEALQEDLLKEYGDKAPNLKIDTELAERYMNAATEAERDAAMREIYRDIGRQMPSRFTDRWNAWRYLAMLGNPRTHVRNIMGNAGFAPLVGVKNLVGTGLESAANAVTGGKVGRTKAILTTKDTDLVKAAWNDYASIEEIALAGGKYDENAVMRKEIEEGRRIFGNTGVKAWDDTLGRGLETARKFNSKALDREDVWFSKPHYASALAQYCKANGITAAQIASGKGLEAARNYAVREAQKATYRDTNDFSQMVSRMGRRNGGNKNKAEKVGATILEGILPFRKTPANILVRGVEYSPIELLKSISYDLYQVKKGNMEATEMLDHLSTGLTGTGVMMLGAYMAAEGLIGMKLRGGGGGDDEEKDFDELRGHQDYSLELPDGTSITLDWLAPEVLPLFVGTNLIEQMQESRNGELAMADVLEAISNVSDPLLQMSCLQSLNDLFDSVGYAASGGTSALGSVVSSAATSYLTQALPTLLGQLERTGEGYRMTTYTDKNRKMLTGDMQYALGRASSRLPGWDYSQIPYIDAWGRMEYPGDVGERAFNNFLNPAYTSRIESGAMEDELERLYDATGEASVLPERAERSFSVNGEQKYLTGEEYVKYASARGQTAYRIVNELTGSAAYRALSDSDKAAAVEDAYKVARASAKMQVSDYEPDGMVAKCIEAKEKYNIDEAQFILLYQQQAGIESLKDSDGETINLSKGLQVMELVYQQKGLSDKQRTALFEAFNVPKSILHYNKALVAEKLKAMRKQAK